MTPTPDLPSFAQPPAGYGTVQCPYCPIWVNKRGMGQHLKDTHPAYCDRCGFLPCKCPA